ncbi:flagellar export chaperone FliS [Sphingomonas sp. RS6]
MSRYATMLAADPARTYRQVDIAGRTGAADPHALVGLLYDEGVAALRTAAWAAEQDKPAVKSERVARATAVLFALEAGLDFDKGGEVAHTLSRFYHGLRGAIVRASLGNDPAPFRAAATDLADIAGAWATMRG